MSCFNYPWTNTHELNLDWIIGVVKKLDKIVDDFVAFNKLTWKGTWDISEYYPKWSIVEDDGNGYLSIQPVPRNVPISDVNYWVQVADYDALYSAFGQRITALETSVGDENSGIIKDIADLKNEDIAIKGIINLNPFSLNQIVLFVGDSYANPLYGDWINKTIVKLGLTLGVNAFNCAYDGSSFAEGTWKQLLEQWEEAHPELVDKVGLIIFGGGINDCTSEHLPLIDGQMEICADYVKATFPNAIMKLFWFGWALETSSILLGRNYLNRTIAHSVWTASSKYGYIFVPGTESVLHNRNYIGTDGLHPNADGGEAIADKIYNNIKNGCCDTTYIANASITPTSGTLGGYVSQIISNNMILTDFTFFALSSCNYAFANGDFTTLGTCELGLGNILPDTYTKALIYTDKPLLVDVVIRVVNDYLQMAIKSIDPDTNNFYNVTALNISNVTLHNARPCITD